MAQQQQTVKCCILGFGIAGQLLVLELLKSNYVPSELCICDETMLGGSLSTVYSTVLSNTPWWKTRKALQEYPQWSSHAIQEGDALFKQEDCMPVRTIANYCLMTATAASRDTIKHRTHVTNVKQTDTNSWTVTHTFGTITCKTLFLTHGATPKTLNLPYPSIPLSIALDIDQLKHHVSTKDSITLFGTAHSGTIILQNLNTLSIPTTALYNSKVPFRFARDGAYDGIKEGSEKIADSILKGEYINTRLTPMSDTLEVHRTLLKTTKCIYAIGFDTAILDGITTAYDPMTAQIQGMANVYGFGIAYPGTTQVHDRIYPDVSVLSFQEQIRKCLPAILEKEKEHE